MVCAAGMAMRQGIEMGKLEAREVVYGMPYAEWEDKHRI